MRFMRIGSTLAVLTVSAIAPVALASDEGRRSSRLDAIRSAGHRLAILMSRRKSIIYGVR